MRCVISHALNRTVEELWTLDDTDTSTTAGPSTDDIEELAASIGMGSAAATERQAARTNAEVLPAPLPPAGNGGRIASPPSNNKNSMVE